MNTTDPVEAAMARVIQARTQLAVQDILAHRARTPVTTRHDCIRSGCGPVCTYGDW